MNCTEVRQQLLPMMASGRDIADDVQLTTHLASCELCRQRYSDLQLEYTLQQIIIPAPRADFFEQSIANAVSLAAPNRFKQLPRAVASLLVVAVLSTVIYQQYTSDDTDANSQSYPLRMAVNQVKNISVIIESDSYRSDTEINIVLADNMSVEGYNNNRSIRWKTALQVGKNVIPLSLIMKNNEAGYVDISYQSGEDIGSVRVAVNGA